MIWEDAAVPELCRRNEGMRGRRQEMTMADSGVTEDVPPFPLLAELATYLKALDVSDESISAIESNEGCSGTVATRRDIVPAVEDVCDMLFDESFEAALDYLFQEGKGDVASALLRPDILRESLVLRVSEGATDGLSFTAQYHTLIVPNSGPVEVFSGGQPFVLGVVVSVNSGAPGVTATCGKLNVGRLALNTRTKQVIYVHDTDACSSVCMVEIYNPTSTIGAQFVWASFDREKLCQAVRMRDRALVYKAFIMALSHSMVHHCVVCGQPPAALCGCRHIGYVDNRPVTYHLSEFLARYKGMMQGQISPSFHPNLPTEVVGYLVSNAMQSAPPGDAYSILLEDEQVDHKMCVSKDSLDQFRLAHTGLGACWEWAAIPKTPVPVILPLPSTAADRVSCQPNVAQAVTQTKTSEQGTTERETRPSETQTAAQQYLLETLTQREEARRKRQERNRASAKRANERRRLATIELKAAIAESHQKAQRLRMRKAELERENRVMAVAIAKNTQHRKTAMTSGKGGRNASG